MIRGLTVLCASIALLSTAHGQTTPDLDGSYTCVGRCANSPAARIIQNGSSVTCINEKNEPSKGAIVGGDIVGCWGGKGVVSHDQKSIEWQMNGQSNDTWWVKSKSQ